MNYWQKSGYCCPECNSKTIPIFGGYDGGVSLAKTRELKLGEWKCGGCGTFEGQPTRWCEKCDKGCVPRKLKGYSY